MVQQKVEVRLKTGLQARPAALFVQEANRFTSDVFLEKDGKKVNAKSIMNLLMLAAKKGDTIKIRCEGDDEEAAMNAICDLINRRFEEDE